ncbi:RNA-guided endonuclease InsQ/TnpB family protein [Streptomyces sp. NPDC005529]|uniref:RNA-guided endonuclease InsQ/TnpB family protein n=1 Tax=unclassified Streptomyces TaxID=2593676 RepID=UPI0033A67E1A
MQLRYNFRVYPEPAQRRALARAFGCARVVFNDGLRARQEAHAAGLPYIKDTDLQKQVITAAKGTEERVWLAEVSSVVLVQSLRDLHTAYRNFFTCLTGKRKGPKVASPRFKSKRDNRQSIRLTANGFSLRGNGKLYVAKVGDLRVRWSRPLPTTPTSVTLTMDASGRYFASFVIHTDASEVLPETTGMVGIDLGLTHFAVFSDGRKIASPRFFRRAEKKLRKAQQHLARKTRGSNNRKKAVVKVARAHARIADARRDFHHKLSTTIIRENQAVHVEDLAVKGLARTRLAKSVHDAGWSAFVGMLEYKATRYGRTFTRVDRFFPSSQLCSVCGVKDGPKPLDVREWTCQACGTVHDRDVNAARNIRAEGSNVAAGHAETQNARGAQVRPALVPAPRATPAPARKKQEPTRSSQPCSWMQTGIPGLQAREDVKS